MALVVGGLLAEGAGCSSAASFNDSVGAVALPFREGSSSYRKAQDSDVPLGQRTFTFTGFLFVASFVCVDPKVSSVHTFGLCEVARTD